MDDDSLEVKNIPRATAMLEFLVYDPTAVRKTPFSLASMPMDSSFGGNGVQGSLKANWTMLETVGRALQHSSSIIAGVCFDAHCSHSFVRKLLHGQLEDINPDEVRSIAFFNSLQYKPLPDHTLPRLPLQIAMHDGKPFFAMCGGCALKDLVCERFLHLRACICVTDINRH